jgi:pimeloyl-ACP methyl ester carboxylesterase
MGLTESKHRVRDIGVRMRRGGTGEPVLFLHGAAGVPEPLPFFERLAGRHELLIPEHPGYGLSDHPPWIRNVADMAMYYLDVLDGLGLPKVHLVGHSLGGWIAAELAVRNCARLASLTLLAPAGVRVKGVLSGDTFIWSPEELARNLFHDQSFAERMLAQPPSPEQMDQQLTNRYMTAKLGWEPRWFSPSLERWLHRITVPTLVVWGREDQVMPSAYAAVWGRRVPDVRVAIIPEAGHLAYVEKADVVADKILAFLDGGGR